MSEVAGEPAAAVSAPTASGVKEEFKEEPKTSIESLNTTNKEALAGGEQQTDSCITKTPTKHQDVCSKSPAAELGSDSLNLTDDSSRQKLSSHRNGRKQKVENGGDEESNSNDLEHNALDDDSEDVDDEEEEDEDDVKVTIEDTVPDYNLRAKQRPAQQAKPMAIDLEAGQAILDVDLSTLEDKPWRKPGADISDYFNYGFDENTWKLYCEKQKKMKNVVSELTNSETFKIPVVNPAGDHSKYSGVMKIPTIVSTEPRFQAWIPPTAVVEIDEERERERERDRHRDREREKARDREKDRDREKEKIRDREKERDREKDRDRDKERDREKERDRDKDRDRDKTSRSSGRERDKTRDRERHRDAGKKRERSRERDRDKKRKRSR